MPNFIQLVICTCFEYCMIIFSHQLWSASISLCFILMKHGFICLSVINIIFYIISSLLVMLQLSMLIAHLFLQYLALLIAPSIISAGQLDINAKLTMAIRNFMHSNSKLLCYSMESLATFLVLMKAVKMMPICYQRVTCLRDLLNLLFMRVYLEMHLLKSAHYKFMKI